MAELDQHHVHIGPRPSRKMLLEALKRFVEQFSPITIEEEECCPVHNGSPYVLVALDVDIDWKPPATWHSVFSPFGRPRFWVVPVPGIHQSGATRNALFITAMASPEHGTALSFLQSTAVKWKIVNDLEETMMVDGDCGRGRGKQEPDLRVRPGLQSSVDTDAKGFPNPRVVMEVEYANRNANRTREDGFLFMEEQHCRGFLAVKMWKRSDVDGRFGAVAALWLKGDDDKTYLAQAMEFGTRAIDARVRRSWSASLDASSSLPPVTHFETPPGDFKPGELRTVPAGWNLTVPAAGVLDYQLVPSDVRATIKDMVIDLHKYQVWLDAQIPWGVQPQSGVGGKLGEGCDGDGDKGGGLGGGDM